MADANNLNTDGHCSSEYVGDIVFALPNGEKVERGMCQNDKTGDGLSHLIISGITKECLERVHSSLLVSHPTGGREIFYDSQMLPGSVNFFDKFCPMYRGVDAVVPELLGKIIIDGKVGAVVQQIFDKALEIIDQGCESLTIDVALEQT